MPKRIRWAIPGCEKMVSRDFTLPVDIKKDNTTIQAFESNKALTHGAAISPHFVKANSLISFLDNSYDVFTFMKHWINAARKKNIFALKNSFLANESSSYIFIE